MPSPRSPSQRTPEGRKGRQLSALLAGTNAGRMISASRRTTTAPTRATPSGSEERVNTVASSGSTETLPDVTVATVHYVTLTANCTLTFPTEVAGKSFTLVLVQDGTGSRLVTWPGSVRWSAGTAPTLTATASKRDVFSFLCADGSTYLGFTAGLNYT